MSSVFNSHRERDFIHSVPGAGGKSITYRLIHNKVTEVPDAVLEAMRKNLSPSDNEKLIEGDKSIARARASSKALLNAEKLRADAAEKENADLKARIEALEKLMKGKNGNA